MWQEYSQPWVTSKVLHREPESPMHDLPEARDPGQGLSGSAGGWTQLDLAALGGYRRSHSKLVFTAKPLPVQKAPSSRRHRATVQLVSSVQGTR